MTKHTLTAAIVSLGAAIVLTAPLQAGVIVNETLSLPAPGYYDSPNGYDFVNTFPVDGTGTFVPGTTAIGTFTFSIPAGLAITGGTISGTFGNGDSPTTALSDYYLGFAGDETAVEVASCDDISDDCYSNQNGPTSWTYTLTSSDLATLSNAIAAGSLDFTYTWDDNTEFALSGDPQSVYAGAPTLQLVTPEPASVLIFFGGLAGIAGLRRRRKV